MRSFHGDLLMGGTSIRDLDGELEDVADSDGVHQEGRFVVTSRNQPGLEMGRPYLLLLQDGETLKLVVTEIEPSRAHDGIIVQFESTD